MKIFDPFSTQSSPSRSARVTSDAGIGAAARLGQRVAAERLAAAHARQPLGLLLLRPPLRDRLAGETVVDRDDPAHRRVGAAELLHHEAVRHRVEPHAAVLLGQRAAEEADVGELRDDPEIHPLRAVPLARVRDDLAVAERARGLADQLLLLGELEVHDRRILSQMPNLAGKVAIVTGAGRGIGRAHALALADAGAKVVVNDLGAALSGEGHDDSPAQQVVQEIEAAGGEAAANGENVADFAGAERLVAQALERVRPPRHPREQRRDPARPHAREHDRGRVGRRHRRASQGPLRADAARRGATGASARRRATRSRAA